MGMGFLANSKVGWYFLVMVVQIRLLLSSVLAIVSMYRFGKIKSICLAAQGKVSQSKKREIGFYQKRTMHGVTLKIEYISGEYIC